MNKLRFLRTVALNMKQADLAKVAGRSQMWLSAAETGKDIKDPNSRGALAKLAKYLDVYPPEKLLEEVTRKDWDDVTRLWEIAAAERGVVVPDPKPKDAKPKSKTTPARKPATRKGRMRS
jgi:transcriptional regulator with XRE-family HTH domain